MLVLPTHRGPFLGFFLTLFTTEYKCLLTAHPQLTARHIHSFCWNAQCIFFRSHTVTAGVGTNASPKLLLSTADLKKQGRIDTSSNWFQGIKTGLAAKQIRLVPVPALTRRQGYRAKMTQSYFFLGGFVFFLSLSYILHSLAASFFVSGRLLPWPVTPSQGWKATYDKFFFPDQKKLQNYLILHFFNARRPWSLLHCIRTKPQPHWFKV